VGAGPLSVSARAAAGEHPPRPPIPIVPVDERARRAARERMGDHGTLGELAAWLAGVTCSERPAARGRVVLASGRTGRDEARSLERAARELEADVVLADPGVPPAREPSAGPALEVAEVAAAVDTGRELAARARREGITVLAGAAPSPGAILAATSIAAALSGRPPAGPHAERAARALARHAGAIHGPLGALRRLGDGDLALLCGVALGAGEQGLGFLCDGLTGTAAAAVAAAVEPDLRPRLLAARRPADPAHGDLLDHVGLPPAIGVAVRVEDGSGALAAIALLRVAAALARGGPA
jgi:nicotinate-nucleotide--dimethylbenzimidazole phosphoribosyltransferase